MLLGEVVTRAAAFLRVGPWAVLGRAALVVAVALPAAWVHQHDDPGALCPLRRLTGVPCPVCGSTTVLMELGAGHLGAALLANPVTAGAMALLVLAPLGLGRWWWRADGRLRVGALAVAVVVAWLWELRRFGFLG